MTQDERKVIEMALEALETAESCIDGYHGDAYLLIDTSITAMKELLAQPEQEYGVVAGIGKGVEIPACVKYYYIEPKLPPQPEKPDQDEVDIRSRLYQRIHELETQLAQPEDKKCENCGEFGECCQDAQPEQELVVWVDSLFNEIKHGDEEHQLWLYEKLKSWAQPPKHKPLTPEQILAANYPDGEENGPTIAAPDFELICFARQIEAAHNIKE